LVGYQEIPVRVDGVENVHPQRIRQVGRIKIHDLVRARRGNFVQKGGGHITMRINQRHPVAGRDVLQHHIPE
jgi:hypothetical protein